MLVQHSKLMRIHGICSSTSIWQHRDMCTQAMEGWTHGIRPTPVCPPSSWLTSTLSGAIQQAKVKTWRN